MRSCLTPIYKSCEYKAGINKKNMMDIKNVKIAVLLIAALAILSAGIAFTKQTRDKNIKIAENKSEQEKEADAIKEENKGILSGIEGEEPAAVKPIGEDDYYRGKLSAPVQVIVYSDFAGQFCSDYKKTLEKAQQEFGEKIAIAFRHFPSSISQNSMPAALAAECAAEQGKFWEMREQLYADYESGDMSLTGYKEDAEEIGLDQNKFSQCLDSGKFNDKIETQIAEAKNAGVTGAPTTFINSEFAIGAVPYEDYVDSVGNNEPGLKTRIEKFVK